MIRRTLATNEVCSISQVELVSLIEACKDEHWLKAMEE